MKKWTDNFTSTDLIIHEDQEFLILNKPPGINSQNDQTGDLSLCAWAEDHKNRKLHIANRIDRPVSGIVLLVKNKKGLQQIKNPSVIHKEYLALVAPIEPAYAKLKHYIKRDGRTKKAYISESEHKDYKMCSLEYETIHELDKYHLLKIKTQTGRFHQIRAQLGHIGFPIKGDVKYGARRGNKDRSIDLHAYKLTITSLDLEVQALPIGRENIWRHIVSEEII